MQNFTFQRSLSVRNPSDLGVYMVASSPVDKSVHIPTEADYVAPQSTMVLESKTHIPSGAAGVLKLTIYGPKKEFIFEGVAPVGKREVLIDPVNQKIQYDEVVCADCSKQNLSWADIVGSWKTWAILVLVVILILSGIYYYRRGTE